MTFSHALLLLHFVVVFANLKITARRNHMFVPSYATGGRDATVVYGTQDFKFKNSRTYPIKFEANVANGIVEFRTPLILSAAIFKLPLRFLLLASYFVEPDPTLAPGQQVIEQAGHSGYKVTTYLEKRLAGTVISKEILSNDSYKAMPTIVHIGQ